jgi:hypothetical protein
MGGRFRQSFKVFPGVRINLSKSGLSTTIGRGPASLNIGPRGAHVNLNIPGTGLSYRHKLSGGNAPREGHGVQLPALRPDTAPPALPPLVPAYGFEKQEIKSASTYELTSEGLRELHKLITEVDAEQRKLDAEIATMQPKWHAVTSRHKRWENGFLFKKLMKGRFARLQQEAQEAQERWDELLEQRRLTQIATEIEVAPDMKPAFGRLFDTFAALSAVSRIWDTISTRRADRFRERTTATSNIERTPVQFTFAQSDLFNCEWKVPRLGNANGGDMFIYPGFLLYRVTKAAFSVIDCRDVNVEFAASRFIEEEQVPSDSQVVGYTWKYANKNGTPDRRFANNYQIPIAAYGRISLTSPTGLNEEYMISNYQAAESFVAAWKVFKAALSN